MNELILRFGSFGELDCGTEINLEFEIKGKTVIEIADILCAIDFEPFNSSHNGFMEGYTINGDYGFGSAYDLDELDEFDIGGFDILFSFNDDDTTIITGRNTIDDLAKYVLDVIKTHPGAATTLISSDALIEN